MNLSPEASVFGNYVIHIILKWVKTRKIFFYLQAHRSIWITNILCIKECNKTKLFFREKILTLERNNCDVLWYSSNQISWTVYFFFFYLHNLTREYILVQFVYSNFYREISIEVCVRFLIFNFLNSRQYGKIFFDHY